MPQTWVTGRQQGFTLLELMVVMAILVLIAVLFPVALDHALPSHRVRATTEQLMARVHEAQNSSLFSGKAVSLSLVGHRLLTQDPSTRASLGHPLPLPNSTQVRLVDLEGRPLSGLIVYPDGSAQAARFEVEDNGHRGTVRVAAVTGRVTNASEP